MQEARLVSLIPRTTLHSDSKQGKRTFLFTRHQTDSEPLSDSQTSFHTLCQTDNKFPYTASEAQTSFHTCHQTDRHPRHHTDRLPFRASVRQSDILPFTASDRQQLSIHCIRSTDIFPYLPSDRQTSFHILNQTDSYFSLLCISAYTCSVVWGGDQFLKTRIALHRNLLT